MSKDVIDATDLMVKPINLYFSSSCIRMYRYSTELDANGYIKLAPNFSVTPDGMANSRTVNNNYMRLSSVHSTDRIKQSGENPFTPRGFGAGYLRPVLIKPDVTAEELSDALGVTVTIETELLPIALKPMDCIGYHEHTLRLKV